MLHQQRAFLASVPASAFPRAHRGMATVVPCIQLSDAYHRKLRCAPSTPSLVAQRAHKIGTPPPHRRIISKHIKSQWKDLVLAKQHYGTQSTPAPSTIMYSPAVSWGLVQGSRTMEKTRKPVEVDSLALDAVESVESRTHIYPHAEGAVFAYPSYDAQRRLFKAAMHAITRTCKHEFGISSVINSSRGKLRALYLKEQRARSLNPTAAKRRVMNSSKDRVRTFYTDERLALPSIQTPERLWREIKKREMSSVRLCRDRADTYWEHHLVENMGHSYRACFMHLRVRKPVMDDGTYTILKSKVALDLKAANVSMSVFESVVAMKQLVSINLTSSELLQATRDPASSNSSSSSRFGGMMTFHGRQVLNRDMVVQLEMLVADIRYIETFVRASTAVLMDLDLLECGLLGHAQIRVLAAKFTSFKSVTRNDEINSTSGSSAFTLMLKESNPCLRQIESHFIEFMRDVYEETRSAIGEFEQSLMRRSKEIEAPGALLPYHEKLRRSVLLDIGLGYVGFYRTFVRYLRSCGYKPSKLYMKYCIRAKNAKERSNLRQTLHLSALECLPRERTAHRERVRTLHGALLKKRMAVQQREGRIFAFKQHLKSRKHFVMQDLVRYQRVRSRLKLRAARKKSWRRRWEPYVREIYSTQDESEDKQWTMANIALHMPDRKEHERCYLRILVTPLFSLPKQRRRRKKRMLQGHFPPIVNITQSSPTLTLGKTNTSLVRVLRILGLEESFGDVKANDVSKRDKGIHNQSRRPSTHSRLTRFTPSSRLQASRTSVCYTESPMMRRDSGQYESADSGNGHTKGSDDLNESATNNDIYNNDTPSKENQSSIPNNDMRDDAEQSRDEERDNESSSESEIKSESDEEQEIHVSLSFQIPEDMLREAMQASPNSQASFYSHRLYRGPEDEMLSVHYCRNIEVAERAAKLFVDEKVLGFDIEWKPWASPHSIKDNASLIQLASEDRIVLFHISLFSGDTPDELLPPTLKTILESSDITKVGVAIKGDFTRLKNHLGVQARGVFEISRLHNIVEHHNSPDKITKRLVSLARQTQQHLQLPLFKGDVRESDWSKQLDTDQMRYAATDAYAGLRIFDALEAKRKKLRPIPPLPGLCDNDERMHKRAKAPPKSAASKEPEEVPKAVEAIEQEEDTEGYETAPEELMDNHGLEAASDSDSASASQTSNQGDDFDADHTPQFQRVSQATVDLDKQENATFNSPPKTRRVGRGDFSRLNSVDPGYPKLPRLSSKDEDGSDSSDAFDPIPQTRSQRRDVKDATSQEASGHVDNDHERGEEKEMEELMLAMDIDDVLKVEEGQSVITNNQQDEVEQHLVQPTSSAMLEQKEDGDCVVASPSETAPTSKEKKKRKHGAVDSRSTKTSISAGDTTLSPPHFNPLVPDTTSKSPEYLLAETWAQAYLRSTIPSPSTSSSFNSLPSRIRATVPHIRAYHLWYHQRLALEEVAAHLRDPPLAISTVSSYIAQAVNLEMLEYNNEDLRVVLAGLPLGLRMGRYRKLVDRINRRGAGGSGSGSDG